MSLALPLVRQTLRAAHRRIALLTLRIEDKEKLSIREYDAEEQSWDRGRIAGMEEAAGLLDALYTALSGSIYRFEDEDWPRFADPDDPALCRPQEPVPINEADQVRDEEEI